MPLHMVGHSMGGDTSRTLQHLLAEKRRAAVAISRVSPAGPGRPRG
eukprot:gene3027-22697_t